MNIKIPRGDTPLHEALKLKTLDIALIHKLLVACTDVNSQNFEGDTPLHVALKRETYNLDIIRCLLNADVDVNIVNNNGHTFLFYALSRDSNDSMTVVKQLLRLGASIETQNIHGLTPLCHALCFNNAPAALELLRSGAKVNITYGRKSVSPLHQAARMYPPSVEVVQELLRRGADVEAEDYLGATSILYTTNAGIIDILIQFGADVKKTDYRLNTLLHLITSSWQESSIEVIRMLVQKYGINVNVQNQSGRTPLICAARNKNLKAMQELINLGADLDIAESSGYTALHISVELLNSKQVGLCLSHGANPNAKARFQITPLWWAVTRCYDEDTDYNENTDDAIEIIKLLMQSGARMNKLMLNEVINCFNGFPSAALAHIKLLLKYGCVQNIHYSLGLGVDLTTFRRGKQRFSWSNVPRWLELSEFRGKNCYSKMKSYQNSLNKELTSMYNRILHCNSSLMKCVFLGSSLWCHPSFVKDEILKVILKNEYPIFNDILIEQLGRAFFLERLAERKIYCSNSSNHQVTLNARNVQDVAFYLSSEDMVRLMQACDLSFKIPSQLKSKPPRKRCSGSIPKQPKKSKKDVLA